ncbi:MAG: hypothetical protein AAF380_02930 [Bacteroidota bacterium]
MSQATKVVHLAKLDTPNSIRQCTTRICTKKQYAPGVLLFDDQGQANRKAKVNKKNRNRAPLALAAAEGEEDLLGLLLSHPK